MWSAVNRKIFFSINLIAINWIYWRSYAVRVKIGEYTIYMMNGNVSFSTMVAGTGQVSYLKLGCVFVHFRPTYREVTYLRNKKKCF